MNTINNVYIAHRGSGRQQSVIMWGNRNSFPVVDFIHLQHCHICDMHKHKPDGEIWFTYYVSSVFFLVTFGCESVFLANWPLTVLAEFYKELLVKWGNDYCPSYSRESVFVVCQSVRGFSCLSCGQLCGQFNACKTRNLQRGGECFQGPFQI